MPVFNTALLRSYVDLLPEFPMLSMVIKRWAKACKIGQVQSGAISSYAWTQVTVSRAYLVFVSKSLPLPSDKSFGHVLDTVIFVLSGLTNSNGTLRTSSGTIRM